MLKLREQTLWVIQSPPGFMTFYSAVALDNIWMGFTGPKLNVQSRLLYLCLSPAWKGSLNGFVPDLEAHC